MALAAALSVAQFGNPPRPPSDRPTELQNVPKGQKERVLGTKWSMEKMFRRWYQLAGDRDSIHMRCPVCLQEMSRLSVTGGAPSRTAPKGVRWTTVDHIIHIDHEECYWCVWPMCNECNSSKGTNDLRKWLPERLSAMGRDPDGLRGRVKSARDLILGAAPHGHTKGHDCTDSAPLRKAYGCVIGQHEWKWDGFWKPLSQFAHIHREYRRFRCGRPHCGKASKVTRGNGLLCTICGCDNSLTKSLPPQCMDGTCRGHFRRTGSGSW